MPGLVLDRQTGGQVRLEPVAHGALGRPQADRGVRGRSPRRGRGPPPGRARRAPTGRPGPARTPRPRPLGDRSAPGPGPGCARPAGTAAGCRRRPAPGRGSPRVGRPWRCRPRRPGRSTGPARSRHLARTPRPRPRWADPAPERRRRPRRTPPAAPGAGRRPARSRSLRSAPTQNASGRALASTTTLTSGSAARVRAASASRRACSVDSALRASGRSITSSATCGAGRSTRTVMPAGGRSGRYRRAAG